MSNIHRSAVMSDDDYMRKLAERRLEIGGSEIPDPTPLEPPVGYVKQPSIFERMREMVNREMAMRMQYEGEDYDDEEDFDTGEDEFPMSPHEYTEDDERFVRSEVVRLTKERDELRVRLEKEKSELEDFRRQSAEMRKASAPGAPTLPQAVPPKAE